MSRVLMRTQRRWVDGSGTIDNATTLIQTGKIRYMSRQKEQEEQKEQKEQRKERGQSDDWIAVALTL